MNQLRDGTQDRSRGRTLRLAGFLKPAGEYLAGWRHPEAPPHAGVDLRYLAGLVQRLEAAAFDAVFVPDLSGVPSDDDEVLTRVAAVNDGFEPLTLLSALSSVTSRIGLIGTASTSFTEPYTLARALASLDHLSHGRAGWNVVTSLTDHEAANFGLDAHLDHGDRYRRADEFLDVVEGLWDSFDDDAFEHDAATGRYFDAGRLHALRHDGEFFRVAGPLNIPRSPQGRPVIAQAGSSEAGRDMAARRADLVFSTALDLEDARAYYADIKRRVWEAGRDPDHVSVLPELATVIAPSRAEAEDRFAELRSLLPARVALADVEYWLGGVDLTGASLDDPLPELPETNRSKGTRADIYRDARRSGKTLGDLVEIVAAGDRAVIGTPDDVADYVEERFTGGAADGFTVSFPWLPTTLHDFTDQVVPVLRRRGLVTDSYRGETLRDHLGLPRPESRWTPTPAGSHRPLSTHRTGGTP